MAESSYDSFPEVGELVVATVSSITDYGAYVKLDEYRNIEGLLHISEISSGWVKNIYDYVREGQKLVLKVLRVDKEKGHVDLSLRRVSKREKQEKMAEWKRKKRALSILEAAAQKVNLDPEKLVNEIVPVFEDKLGGLYEGLEELVEKGEELAEKLKLPSEWVKAIYDVAKQKIKPQAVSIKGILKLTTTAPNGVEIIKKILMESKSVRRFRKARVDIYTIGAPRYVVEVTAKNYKDAEKVLNEVVSYALKEIKSTGGEGEFKR
ncbi:MAG: translation initiation factor IF-2 subunit alpha [Candidatus Bathyarchaeota archaeon]|nr:translation initiation factor IF-2 subunit alpha [Candidatus Bathyarchaeota archaeon]